MSTWKASRGVSKFVGLLTLLSLVLLSTQAAAAGRVQWTKTTIQETDGSGGSWKLEIKVFLSKTPGIAHVPVKFEFSPIAYYERSMVDGDKLVERRVPLTGKQDIIESVDLGFMDPGSGKLEKRTRFSFKVTRAHGFEAGEYKVAIRDARSGQVIGGSTTIKLEGQNEVIDRRAMVFAAPGKKKDGKKDEKKDEPAAADGEGGEGSGENTESAESTPDSMPEAVDPEEPPQEIKEKPGGCGCRTQGSSGTPAGAWLLSASVLGLFWSRRRLRTAG